MRKIIRKKAFETNSSSSHSISLASNDKEFILDMIYPNEEGNIVVEGDSEFGWAWDKINDAYQKLEYAYIGGVNEELLTRVIKEQTGCNEVIFNEISGYIDHESYGTVNNICVDFESTRNFIFNKNSWLVTGNDNSRKPRDYFHYPIYTKEGIIPVKYKYILYINDKNNNHKFITFPSLDEYNECLSDLCSDIEITKNGNRYSHEWSNINNPNNKEVILFSRSDTHELRKKLSKNESFKNLNWTQKTDLCHFISMMKERNYVKLKVNLDELPL